MAARYPATVAWLERASLLWARVIRGMSSMAITVAFLALAFAGSFLALQTLWAGAYAYALGLEAVKVGNLLLLYSGGAVLGFLVSGYLADRLGTARVLVGAALLFALGLLLALFKLLALAYPLMGFFGAFNILTLTQALGFQKGALHPSPLSGSSAPRPGPGTWPWP